MRNLTKDDCQPILDLVILIEKIVAPQQLEKDHHQETIEMFLNYILQGEDRVNPYERRKAKVDDETWQEIIKRALYFLNLKSSYEKIFRN